MANISNFVRGSNYAGTDLMASWYSTHLRSYTNMLRAIQPTDEAIMVLFGCGHVPIPKHLFESNPRFEVAQLLTKQFGNCGLAAVAGQYRNRPRPTDCVMVRRGR